MTSRPAADHRARRDALRPSLDVVGADLLLVTAPANVRYLTGFSGSNGQVIVGAAADDDRLITDDRYRERAVGAGVTPAVTRDPLETVLDHPVVAGGAGRSGRSGQSAAAGAVCLAVEADHVSLATAERWRERTRDAGVDMIGTTDLVESLRRVKDDVEVVALADACRLTVLALEELLAERVAAGVTERSLATWLERRFVDLGADGVAFPSIVASGPNAAIPHHEPGERPLTAGDLLTVDCGARVEGYHADCTRTVAVGHLDDALAEVHALVEAAQAAGRRAAIAGATGGDVDAACRSMIAAAGHGDRFVHGTGHGVGLDIHEAPAVARDGSAVLEAGVVMTVEPGVYVPGVGGVRIEDTVVVRDEGPPRVLTEMPRVLRVL